MSSHSGGNIPIGLMSEWDHPKRDKAKKAAIDGGKKAAAEEPTTAFVFAGKNADEEVTIDMDAATRLVDAVASVDGLDGRKGAEAVTRLWEVVRRPDGSHRRIQLFLLQRRRKRRSQRDRSKHLPRHALKKRRLSRSHQVRQVQNPTPLLFYLAVLLGKKLIYSSKGQRGTFSRSGQINKPRVSS